VQLERRTCHSSNPLTWLHVSCSLRCVDLVAYCCFRGLKEEQPVEGIVIRIATDLNLFTILAEKSGPMNLGQLAEVTKADPVLLSKYML